MATVRIPPVLRNLTGGQRDVSVEEGNTVGEVLLRLGDLYPGLTDRLYQDGSLHRYVNVYVNDQDIQQLQRLETPVSSQDTIIILPAMAGG